MPTGSQPHWTHENKPVAGDKALASTIVVGFDDSEGSRRALHWAIEEATLRHAPLKVVQAWTPGEFGAEGEASVFHQAQLHKIVAEEIGDAEITWEALVDRGPASKVLLEHANGTRMLVVGSHGHGGITGLLLGSVSIQVSTHPGAAAVVIVKDH